MYHSISSCLRKVGSVCLCMGNTRSKIRYQNHDDDDDDDDDDDSSSTRRFNTFYNNHVALWSDVNHDVLFLVMMQLGFVDFIAFSGVCKLWRSLALVNKKMFMASLPPMPMRILTDANEKDSYCQLEDFEGRRFKTILPHSAGRIYFRSTCGYLVLFGWKTRDFWLVNPITRHELYFPDWPLHVGEAIEIKAILVFSPSISGWVFVVVHRKLWSYRHKSKMLFCIAGKRGWNHVSSTSSILDVHYFKGKIYTLHFDCSLCELRLDQKSQCKWTLVETKIFLKPDFIYTDLVSSGENLYMINLYRPVNQVLELNFGEMKWVMPEKTIEEYAFFISKFNYSTVIKPESWADPRTQYKIYDQFFYEDKIRKCLLCEEWMWYFPDDCLNVNVNILDE